MLKPRETGTLNWTLLSRGIFLLNRRIIQLYSIYCMLKSFSCWLQEAVWEPEAWEGNARRYPVSDIERGWKLIGKTGLRRRVMLAKPDGQLMYLIYDNGVVAHKEMMQADNLYHVDHIVSMLELVPIDENNWHMFFKFPQQMNQP